MTEEFKNPLKFFKSKMLDKLLENSDKSGWEEMSRDEIQERIKDELEELIESDENYLIDECVDIANFCMFLAYNTRQKLNENDDNIACAFCNDWIFDGEAVYFHNGYILCSSDCKDKYKFRPKQPPGRLIKDGEKPKDISEEFWTQRLPGTRG